MLQRKVLNLGDILIYYHNIIQMKYNIIVVLYQLNTSLYGTTRYIDRDVNKCNFILRNCS